MDAQAGGCVAADERARLDEDGFRALPRGGERGHDAGHAATGYEDIKGFAEEQFVSMHWISFEIDTII
ncbi:MAG: hypothetical protein ACOY5V_07675 [Pseudomonadota bacterium]